MYDAIIIGAGPAGYTCALRLSHFNKKVLVIEKNEVGGVCLLKGCIPTKSIRDDVLLISKIKSRFGININNEYENIIKRKNKVVETLIQGIKFLFKKKGIELIYGIGKIKSENEIEIIKNDNTKETVTGKNIVIATGSSPINIENLEIDHEKVLSSDDILEIKTIPSSLSIIGGGIIGMEFASIFTILETKVKVYEMLPEILSNEDEEIVRELKKNLEIKGVKIITNKKISSFNEIDSEKVLVVVGRKPNINGFENLGIKFNKNGILVNEKMQTNIKNIYAIGDVAGKYQLAYVAMKEGIVAANTIIGIDDKMDYNIIPISIFTYPEIASVGLTEKKAKEKGYKIRISKFPFSALGRAHADSETKGFMKMIIEENTNKILGIQIIGDHATELIGEATALIKFSATCNDVIKLIHPHPTFSEIFSETAYAGLNMPIHI
jgi:dihydrolipoamide dehydrogenase